ncbi:sugar ABC transporter permease [bacterium]|nr:sugar ABC transporter permease [bacterium]
MKRSGLVPYAYLAPALILVAVLSLLPNLYSVYLAFTNYSLYHYNQFDFVGLRNFMKIISGPETATFVRVFIWTVVWAGVSVIGAQVVGIFLAVLLNKPDLKGSSFYRTLFILPWAIPAFISVLMWQGLLNTEFGAFNQILKAFHLDLLLQYILSFLGYNLELPIAWLDKMGWAHISVLMVNIWLAFPFQLTVCLGALQSVPTDVYEAADIDGASPWQQFKLITLPLLRSSLLPVLISSFAFNFNQFTAIYLLTAGGPPIPGSDAGATDILITYSYKLAFNSFQYGLACAYAIFIFVLVAALSGINFKLTGAFDDVN